MDGIDDERAIERQLKNYCRAMDRRDAELGRQVFFADAAADYGAMFQGSGHGFIDFAMAAHTRFDTHLHRISNAVIMVEGDVAVSETYVDAQFRLTEDGRAYEAYTLGRYLDRWERREGHWAIVSRRYVNAMAGKRPVHEATFAPEGARDDTDPSYSHFAQLVRACNRPGLDNLSP